MSKSSAELKSDTLLLATQYLTEAYHADVERSKGGLTQPVYPAPADILALAREFDQHVL